VTDREHNARLLYGVATGSVGVDAALDQLRLPAITTAPAAQPKLVPKPLPRGLGCRVGILGAVSVCGVSPMPVTLYSEQWHRLLDAADGIREFLANPSGEDA
jgi:hypothetical protein